VDDVDEDDVDEDDVEDEDDEACVASECPASAEVDPLPLLLHAATQKAMMTQGTVWRVSISRYYVRCVGSSNERGVRKGTPWHRGRGPHVEARAGTRARVGEPSATVSSVSKQRARARRRVRHRGVLRLWWRLSRRRAERRHGHRHARFHRVARRRRRRGARPMRGQRRGRRDRRARRLPVLDRRGRLARDNFRLHVVERPVAPRRRPPTVHDRDPARRRGDRAERPEGDGMLGMRRDTWTFHGTTWTQEMVTRPSARAGGSMTAMQRGGIPPTRVPLTRERLSRSTRPRS